MGDVLDTSVCLELYIIAEKMKSAHVSQIVPVFVGSALELRQTVKVALRIFIVNHGIL